MLKRIKSDPRTQMIPVVVLTSAAEERDIVESYLRVLILEDRPADVELMLLELRRAGFEPDWQRVETEADYLAQLDPALDIILADYSLPQFDGLRALHLLQESGLNIPFIIVSGVISEDVAVEAMKGGAADYLFKDRLARLGPAVTHALEQSRLREEKRWTEEVKRDYQKKLRSLASKLMKTEEKERRRISEFIHDQIGQKLALVKVEFGQFLDSLSRDESVKTGKEILRLLESTIEDTRSLTFELSPPVLYELGFEPAVEWLTGWLAKKCKIRFIFREDGKPKHLDEEMRVILFLAVKELLLNVIKHSRATSVKVSILRSRSRIQVIVEDDGVGFDTKSIDASSSRTEGFGLFNIRERLMDFAGQVEIVSNIGGGTKATLSAPLALDKKEG